SSSPATATSSAATTSTTRPSPTTCEVKRMRWSRTSVAVGLCLAVFIGLGMGPADAQPTVGKLWVARYNGPGSQADQVSSMVLSPDGSKVYVTGFSKGPSSQPDFATIAYDAGTGAPLWLRRYNGTANLSDSATSIAVSPDGSKVFVTGSSEREVGNPDFVTIAYDAATGTPLWVRRYNGPNDGDDEPTAVGGSVDGSKVFVSGSSDGGRTGSDFAILAYDASTGSPQWATRSNIAGFSDVTQAMAVSPDGSKVLVTGYAWVGHSATDYATVAYDTLT